MSHKQLWAPWRLQYVAIEKDREEGCFLCRYRDEPADDARNFVVARTAECLAVLNRFPYNNGHLLIAPQAHKGQLQELQDDELLGCMKLIQKLVSVYRDILTPDGFNIGLNLGRAAGAGLPDHLHWHLVPRWNGDTNFMPVLAGVDVIPQSLEALYELVQRELKESDGS